MSDLSLTANVSVSRNVCGRRGLKRFILLMKKVYVYPPPQKKPPPQNKTKDTPKSIM